MSIKKLELTERELGDAAVIDIIGELTIGSSREALLEKVRGNIKANRRLLLINMSQCERVDSSGLGELVTCLVTSARHNTRLRLTDVPQQIHGLMKIANLHQAFEIFETDEAALG